eukprot:GFUD01067114.1.p1 GENE.GFUD01067114.1~~GFUD01067114.1.p1  ORF type:complete len:174 (+),score=52.73 GFUD01067114.1:107-628(+)
MFEEKLDSNNNTSSQIPKLCSQNQSEIANLSAVPSHKIDTINSLAKPNTSKDETGTPLQHPTPTGGSVFDLVGLVEKKAELSRDLADLEREIYATEGMYLECTAPDGNLVRGWEGLLATLDMELKPNRSYKKFKESERVFSKSSVSSHSAVNGLDLIGGKSRLKYKKKGGKGS